MILLRGKSLIYILYVNIYYLFVHEEILLIKIHLFI